MSENSEISWTDHTFNPWEGCQNAGPGCDGCYAEARNKRFNGGVAINWGPGAERRRTSSANWKKPLAWDRAHEEFFARTGRRQRVFCASLADVFDNAVDPLWRADLFELIIATPKLDWMLLTKRIGNAQRMIEESFSIVQHLRGHCVGSRWPLENVWVGATVVNPEELARDEPKLMALPAAVHFLSMEPLLAGVDMCEALGIWWNQTTGAFVREPRARVDWVIVGGESGPRARDFNIEWAKAIVRQCNAAGVAVHVKQMGAKPVCQRGEVRIRFQDRAGGDWMEWPTDLRVREFP